MNPSVRGLHIINREASLEDGENKVSNCKNHLSKGPRTTKDSSGEVGKFIDSRFILQQGARLKVQLD